MNATLSPVEFHASEDADFTCAACGRSLKRAVTLSDGRMLGLDCAATALGRPRCRAAYSDIESAARRASATAAGKAWVEANPRGTMTRREWLAPMAATAPYPAGSLEWHIFMSAA